MSDARSTTRAALRLQPASQADVRDQNLALISRLVFSADEPHSRASLTATTGLGRATVSRLTQDLITSGIIHEGTPSDSPKRGRPATPLSPARRTLTGIGLEVNVQYVAGRAIDLSGATLAEFHLGGLNSAEGPDRMLSLLGAAATTMTQGLIASGIQIVGAALAIPGLVNTEDNGVLVAPNLGWSDVRPIEMLGEPWAQTRIPTFARNDADMQSLAAAFTRPGHTRTDSTFLYLAGDVGIGGALRHAGEASHGDHGWAGEIGHVTVDPDGPQCLCGSTGCLEAFAGQSAILAAAGLSAESSTDDLLALLDARDPQACEAIDRAARALGIAIADTINILDVSHVVFGTSLGRLLPSLRERMEAELQRRVIGRVHRNITLSEGPLIKLPACTGAAFEVLHSVITAPSTWVDSQE